MKCVNIFPPASIRLYWKGLPGAKTCCILIIN